MVILIWFEVRCKLRRREFSEGRIRDGTGVPQSVCVSYILMYVVAGVCMCVSGVSVIMMMWGNLNYNSSSMPSEFLYHRRISKFAFKRRQVSIQAFFLRLSPRNLQFTILSLFCSFLRFVLQLDSVRLFFLLCSESDCINVAWLNRLRFLVICAICSS